MKIVYFAKEAWEEAYIRERLPEFELVVRYDTPAEALLVPEFQAHTDAEIVSVFVNGPMGEKEFAQFPKLRLITTRSTGYDHIDVDAARARGVAVATVPGYGVYAVAEFAFGLMLALSRHICEARVRTAGEHRLAQEGLRGFDLAGKTLGIVGCGHIGAHVAKIARGFDMRVLVSDERHDDALAQQLGFAYVELPALLAASDIVTLHAPYLPTTHHLINRTNISQLKKGAYLINTARGALLETEALVEALASGQLGGAGLDVLEDERELTEQEKFLSTHPCVIVTPHIAFDTKEAVARILEGTIENIKSFAAGQPQNTVNP